MMDINEVCTIIDDRTLSWEMRIDASVERIWQAITTEEEMAVWFMKSRLDLRVGGEAMFNLGEGQFGGTISRLDPPHLLEVDEDGGHIRFEVSEDRVALTDQLKPDVLPPGGAGRPGCFQPGGPGTHWDGVAAGWHWFVLALDAHVRDEPLPGEREYQVLTPAYAEWLTERFPG